MIRTSTLAALLASAAVLSACAGESGTVADTTGAATTTSAGTVPNADAVDDRVERALASDSTLRRYGLDADDDDNRVVLKGRVRTEVERSHAQMIARDLAPGLTIENNIRIDANVAGNDNMVDVDDIEDQIDDAIDADSTFRGHDIDVDEDDGRIVLEGRVPAAVKTAAEALARRMAGTVEVVSRITVR